MEAVLHSDGRKMRSRSVNKWDITDVSQVTQNVSLSRTVDYETDVEGKKIN